MIALTIWNNGARERIWIKEFPLDSEPQSAIRIETLLDWKENELSTGNRIRVDRLILRTTETNITKNDTDA